MSQPLPSAALPPPLPRSAFATTLAWVVIVLSGLAIPISIISGLMVAVGSYGTSSVEPIGALIVLAGPPVTLIAGIGLLCRKRWAWLYLLLVLSAIFVTNVHAIFKSPSAPYSYVSADGVATTVLSSGATYSSPLVLISLLLVFTLLSRRVRSEFAASHLAANGSATIGVSSSGGWFGTKASSEKRRGWRVGHKGRDSMYYEELRSGVWQRIDIDGEMLMGRAHHVIYFASPERWQSYPEWAQHRRDEIIARIQSEFRAPDYEYHGVSTESASSPAVVPDWNVKPQAMNKNAAAGSSQGKGFGALFVAVVLLLAVSGGMTWLVTNGLGSGETYFPTKRATQQRTVSRVQEPAMFWISIGLYAAIGTGTLGLAAWGVREGCKLAKRGR